MKRQEVVLTQRIETQYYGLTAKETSLSKAPWYKDKQPHEACVLYVS